MATYTKTILSGSTDGRGILVAATGEPGTTIHTASTTATTMDEIWLYAVNKDSGTDYKLTVQWGVTGDANDWIEQTVTFESGLMLIAPGLILKGNASPLIVRAFAANAANVIIHGYVNQITA